MEVKRKDLSALHKLVYDTIYERLQNGSDIKSIEVAIKFLGQNNYSLDLSKDTGIAKKVTSIPRISDDSLRLVK